MKAVVTLWDIGIRGQGQSGIVAQAFAPIYGKLMKKSVLYVQGSSKNLALLVFRLSHVYFWLKEGS